MALSASAARPEPQQGAQHHHGDDDADAGVVSCLAVAQRQHDVGDGADCRQSGENGDEWVLKCLQELDEGGWALVMRNLVRTILDKADAGFGFRQTLQTASGVGERGLDAVLRFAHRPHRKFSIFLACGRSRWPLVDHVHRLWSSMNARAMARRRTKPPAPHTVRAGWLNRKMDGWLAATERIRRRLFSAWRVLRGHGVSPAVFHGVGLAWCRPPLHGLSRARWQSPSSGIPAGRLPD
jgi:hypothetical protein